MRGDINAVDLYQDKDFLNRVGYGLMDVAAGSTGDVGFEDVRKFSYVAAQEEDPKLYRRRVFELVGRYYPNDLAKALWEKFIEYQIDLHEREGWELSLQEVARRWLEQHGHSFFKDWALARPHLLFRMRNQNEPRRGWVEVGVGVLAPQWRELTEAGFKLGAILLAALLEGPYKRHSYLRMVARLSGHRIHSEAEAEQRQREIEQLACYLSERAGYEFDLREATIEYYRRLNLLAEIEGKTLPKSALFPALLSARQ
jgi:hypothetical protein